MSDKIKLDARDKDAMLDLCERHAELIGEGLTHARESLGDPKYAKKHFEIVRAEIGRMLELMQQIEEGEANDPSG